MFNFLSYFRMANLTKHECRGIVTSDVLVKGLSRGAIATRKLKGVNRDKGHEIYTGSAPYDEGKSLRSSLSGIADISITRERIAWPSSQVDVTFPEPPLGRPFIYRGRRLVALQSPGRLINSVQLGLLTILALQYKSRIHGGLSLRALSRLWALGP